MMSKFQIFTEAPRAIIRVEDLIAKKDAEYPVDPAHNAHPVTTRAGNSGAPGFGNFATLRINSVQQTQTHHPVRADSLDQDANSIEAKGCLKRHVCKDEDGK
jgi:hypothetical protein